MSLPVHHFNVTSRSLLIFALASFGCSADPANQPLVDTDSGAADTSESDSDVVADGGSTHDSDSFVSDTGATDAPASSWKHLSSGTTEDLRGIASGSPTGGGPALLVVVGDNGVVRAGNGISWSAIATTGTTGVNLRAVSASLSGRFSIVGEGGKAYVYAPAEVGLAKWRQIATGFTTNLTATYQGPTETWIFGEGGAAYTFGTLTNPPTLRKVYSGPALTFAGADGFQGPSPSFEPFVWAAGSGGNIFDYDTTLKSLVPQTSGVTATLRSVYAVTTSGGRNFVYAVGDNGTILFSTGDGKWTKQVSTTTAALYGIFGLGEGTIYAVGASGTILRSAGTGTWTAEPSGTTVTLRAGTVTTNASLPVRYVVGDDGTILTQ